MAAHQKPDGKHTYLLTCSLTYLPTLPCLLTFLTRILGSYQIMRIPREACGHTSKNRRDAYLLTYLPTYLPCLTLPHLALTYFTYQDARIPVSSYPIILQILRIPREACGHTSKTERDAYLLTYLFTLPYLALLYFTLLYFTYLR